MTQPNLQALVSKLYYEPGLRDEILRNPIGMLAQFNLDSGDIAAALASILTGDLKIEAVAAGPIVIRSPWPPVGTEDVVLVDINPHATSHGVEFSFIVTGEDLHECYLVAFRCDDDQQYLAHYVALNAEGALTGKVLIQKAGTYSVIVGRNGRYGVLEEMLVVS